MDVMRVRVATALALAAFGFSGAAHAQSAIEGRVDRLEAEMRAVQRKVFPGGAGAQVVEPQYTSPQGPTAAPGLPSGTLASDINARLNAIESQQAALISQVEQLQHRQRQLEDAFGNMKLSFEARLKTLEAEVIEEMILYRGAIILIGGDTLMRGDNLAKLSETGVLICLVATLDAVLQRLHLSMGARYHNPAERSVAVGQLRREWAIRKMNVREFDTTGQTDAEIIDSLAAMWREQAIITSPPGAIHRPVSIRLWPRP